MPPVERMCQAMARCAIPPSSTSHAITIATPMPAAGGTTIARMPARINRTLSAMAQPTDCFAIPTRDDSAIFLLLIGLVLNVRLAGFSLDLLRPSGEIGGPSESNNIQDEMAVLTQLLAGQCEKLILANPHHGFAGFVCE